MAIYRLGIYERWVKKSVKMIIRDIIFYFVDSIIIVLNISSKKSDVLIIRLDAIGDFILWLDSAKEYRRIYPDKKIILLANETWAGLAKCFDYWDEIIPVSLNGLKKFSKYRWQILYKVRKAGYDIVVQSQLSREFLSCDSIVRVSGARERIGSVGDMTHIKPWQKKLSDKWYTKLLSASRKNIMEIERNAEFIRAFTGKSFTPKIPVMPRLIELPISLIPKTRYYIIFAGASSKIKQWPIEKFAEVMNIITKEYNILPVLCGAPLEIALCTELARKAKVNCIDYSGKTNLPEFVEIIRNAYFLIGNDTSAVHIAASVGTPSLCVLGGGHYGRFLPYPESLKGEKPNVVALPMDCYNCDWQCKYMEHQDVAYPCVSNISVKDVIQEVRKIYERLEC